MRFTTIISATFFSWILMIGSVFAAADDDINQLKNSIIALQKANEALEKSRTEDARVRYAEVSREIFKAVQNTQVVVSEFKENSKSQELSALLIELGDVTNISSNTLGYSFKQIIVDSAASSFVRIKNKSSSWERFESIVNKLMQNPLVGVAINSNPIASAIGSIVQTAAAYSVSSYDSSKRVVNTADVISSDELNDFTNKISPYTKFYDRVSLAASKHKFESGALDKKRVAIGVSLNNYTQDLISALQLQSESESGVYSAQLNAIFTVHSPDAFFSDYEKVLSKTIVKNGYKSALRYDQVKLSVEQYCDEFSVVTNGYLSEYKGALESLLAVNDLKFSQKEIKRYISKIERYQEIYSHQISSDAAKDLGESGLLLKTKDNKYKRFDAFEGKMD